MCEMAIVQEKVEDVPKEKDAINESETEPELPPKTGDINNHHMDSTRWDLVNFRQGDIIIGTYAKSGTTWMQQIVSNLVPDVPHDGGIYSICPWVDFRNAPAEIILSLEEQKHRRFLKTHLPFNNIKSSPKPCYIYIMRDGRDVVWSVYNHHKHLLPDSYDVFNGGVFEGSKFPVFEEDQLGTVEYFKRWLEGEGYPFWNFFDNIRSWWNVRNHSRVLLLHFANMKNDLPGEIRKIYRFLKLHGEVIEGSEDEIVNSAAERSSFEYMKSNADSLLPEFGSIWKGGGRTFIHKGTNGRWKEELPEELSHSYERKVVEELGEECAHWLASGTDLAKQV